MRLIGGESRLIIELTVDDKIDLGTQLISLHIGADFQEPRLRNGGQDRQPGPYLLQMFLLHGEEDDMADHAEAPVRFQRVGPRDNTPTPGLQPRTLPCAASGRIAAWKALA
ncbi:hypothetical protein RHECNPAF_1340058 [Rhizobium etli CNPAF512]|nr:hypothetical protein RHECNPAF_1340058 [Rhizobium etli CNPAF512]